MIILIALLFQAVSAILCQRLVKAVSSDNLQATKQLFQENPKFSASCFFDQPMKKALERKNLDMIALLTTHGANPSINDNAALQLAFGAGNSEASKIIASSKRFKFTNEYPAYLAWYDATQKLKDNDAINLFAEAAKEDKNLKKQNDFFSVQYDRFLSGQNVENIYREVQKKKWMCGSEFRIFLLRRRRVNWHWPTLKKGVSHGCGPDSYFFKQEWDLLRVDKCAPSLPSCREVLDLMLIDGNPEVNLLLLDKFGLITDKKAEQRLYIHLLGDNYEALATDLQRIAKAEASTPVLTKIMELIPKRSDEMSFAEFQKHLDFAAISIDTIDEILKGRGASTNDRSNNQKRRNKSSGQQNENIPAMLKILELESLEAASCETISKQYKRKALKIHPDKNLGSQKATEEFKQLQNAYQTLWNKKKCDEE